MVLLSHTTERRTIIDVDSLSYIVSTKITALQTSPPSQDSNLLYLSVSAAVWFSLKHPLFRHVHTQISLIVFNKSLYLLILNLPFLFLNHNNEQLQQFPILNPPDPIPKQTIVFLSFVIPYRIKHCN